MSQSDLTTRLNQAISLVQAGRRGEARPILLALSKEYPQLEQVWMWLATASDDTTDRAQYLRRVLDINPNNEKARTALTRLTGESVPGSGASSRSPQSGGSFTTRRLESWLIAILGLVIIVAVILAVSLTVPTLLTPHPTATTTPTATATATLQYTYTPSITPGGPSLTPYIVPSLPPSWTPSATLASTLTFTPSDTYTPSTTPTTTPTFVIVTRPPTITPGGPTLTDEPITDTPARVAPVAAPPTAASINTAAPQVVVTP